MEYFELYKMCNKINRKSLELNYTRFFGDKKVEFKIKQLDKEYKLCVAELKNKEKLLFSSHEVKN